MQRVFFTKIRLDTVTSVKESVVLMSDRHKKISLSPWLAGLNNQVSGYPKWDTVISPGRIRGLQAVYEDSDRMPDRHIEHVFALF